MAPMSKPAARTIDEYLAPLPPDRRAALQWLRRQIRAAAPGAEECISYGIPAFRLDGRLLVHFGNAAKHCALYPGRIVESFRGELTRYDVSKGTIRFQADHPPPAPLVKRIVKALIARQDARRAAARRRRASRARAGRLG